MMSVLCLRNAKVCEMLVNRYAMDEVCLELMKKHDKERAFLMQGSLLLRSLLSKVPDCEDRLLQNGVMAVIETMKKGDASLQVAARQMRVCLRSVEWCVWENKRILQLHHDCVQTLCDAEKLLDASDLRGNSYHSRTIPFSPFLWSISMTRMLRLP